MQTKALSVVKIWHRQPQEGAVAHELLMGYISMGASRSIVKIAEIYKKKLHLVQNLAIDFKWVSRAAAYDAWLLQVQEDAVINQLQQDGMVFAERRSIFRDREYSLAIKLMDAAEQMLAVPLFEDTVIETQKIKTLANPNGEDVPLQIVRQPTRWTRRDALHYAKVAVDIMRLHLEMETARVNLNVNMGDKNQRLNMAKNALSQWRQNIDTMVDEEMTRNPQQDRNLVKLAILERLPEWAAADWKLEPDQIPLLTEGDEVLPLSLNDISIPDDGYTN